VSKRQRLVIVVTIGLALFVVIPLAAAAVGDRRVENKGIDIRRAAAEAHVTVDQIVAFEFSAGDNPIATQLGVDPVDVSMSQPHPPDYCVAVEIHRLLSTGRLRFIITPDGRFHEAPLC
jgi:hypothetical protein